MGFFLYYCMKFLLGASCLSIRISLKHRFTYTKLSSVGVKNLRNTHFLKLTLLYIGDWGRTIWGSDTITFDID